MNRTLTTIAIAATLTGFAPSVARADNPVTASCDAITVTAADTGSTLLGIDAEPPMKVPAGGTLTYPMPPAESHHWTITVIADGPWTGDPQFSSGDVAECVTPVADVQVAISEPTELWADVALAPPW